MKRSKAYRQALEKIEEDKIYSPMGAIKIIKDTVSTKFDPTLDVSMCMGVDPRKADQMVRGTVNLPHGTGKTSEYSYSPVVRKPMRLARRARISSERTTCSRRSRGGWTDFDAVVATPGHDGQGRHPRQGSRSPRFDAEPEDGHRHDGRRKGPLATSRGARSSFVSTSTPTCNSRSARPPSPQIS